MIAQQTYARLPRAPEQGIFLFGMRGTGKSTWVQQAFPEAQRFGFLDDGLFQSYLRGAHLSGREPLRRRQEPEDAERIR